MGDFTARVNKVASVNNIAVLLLSQTSTKVKTEHGALLRPALSTKPWLESINTRLVLFRDFLTASGWPDEAQESANVRFVGIVKHAGVLYESLERVVPFVVDKVRRLCAETSNTIPPTDRHYPSLECIQLMLLRKQS